MFLSALLAVLAAAPHAKPASPATLTGALQFKIGGRALPVREFLARTGFDSLEVEIAGLSATVDDAGQYGLALPAGSFRFDHLILGHGETERVLFIPATTVTVSGFPGAACVGDLTLGWPSVSSVQHDGFPTASSREDCGAKRYVPPTEAQEFPLPELADPLWIRLLVSPFGGLSWSYNRQSPWAPTVGARLTLLRDPRFWGTFRVVGRLDLLPHATAISGGLEWGPWHGYISLLAEGGFSDVSPRAGGGLVIAPLKHEVALIVRVDYLFVSGLPPLPTYSVGIDLAPIAVLGAFL